jgi:hypothetical protein
MLDEQEQMFDDNGEELPIVIRPRPLTDAPDAAIEVVPLPPPDEARTNATLPGIRIPPP